MIAMLLLLAATSCVCSAFYQRIGEAFPRDVGVGLLVFPKLKFYAARLRECHVKFSLSFGFWILRGVRSLTQAHTHTLMLCGAVV